MKQLFTALIGLLFLASLTSNAQTINRTEYKDKLHAFWLGSCIANWTGLQTEGNRTWVPYYTDADWASFGYITDQNPWQADDDTDIEYIFQHAMDTYSTSKLTGDQIRDQWLEHMDGSFIWVSNQEAYWLMVNQNMSPPATSDPANNPDWEMIDAQLVTEIFGFFAPGNADVALDISYLPIRTMAYHHSQYAAQFYVLMYSYASLVDKNLPLKDQVLWLADQARTHIPNDSYIGYMYDWVRAQYLATADKDDWESVRDAFHYRYMEGGADGYVFRSWVDCGSNFGFSIISLLFGEGDYMRTIRIGSLSGMDSDNPTATWGGLLGFMYGVDGLEEHFNKYDFSEEFNIARTRVGFGGSGSSDSYDTYDGGVGDVEEYYGYTYDTDRTFSEVIFSSGATFGNGGWFANGTLRIQVEKSGVWTDVTPTNDPGYPNADDQGSFASGFQSYTFTLNDEVGTGVRIIGDAGGTTHFVSLSELEAFESGTNIAADGTIIASVTAPTGGGNKDIEIIRDGLMPDPTNNGIDNFPNMADVGISIVDRVVVEQMGGTIDGDNWVLGATNVETHMQQESLQLFPNPSQEGNMITLAANGLEENAMVNVEIVDISGKVVVREQKNITSSNDHIDLSTQNLNTGLYLLKASYGNKNFRKKLIIQ